MANTHHFIKDSSNGRDRDATSDCVIRAIAISLDVPWTEVVELVDSYLVEYPFNKAGHDGTPREVMEDVLDGLGYRRVCPEYSSDLWLQPLKTWIDVERFPSNCVVITRGHAQAVLDNRIHDLTAGTYEDHTYIEEYWVN